MKSDILLREMESLRRIASGGKARSLKEEQKRLQQLHVAAFRRVMRRIRASAGVAA